MWLVKPMLFDPDVTGQINIVRSWTDRSSQYCSILNWPVKPILSDSEPVNPIFSDPELTGQTNIVQFWCDRSNQCCSILMWLVIPMLFDPDVTGHTNVVRSWSDRSNQHCPILNWPVNPILSNLYASDWEMCPTWKLIHVGSFICTLLIVYLYRLIIC